VGCDTSDSALASVHPTCSHVLVAFLECINKIAARGSSLPAAVFISDEDTKLLYLTAD
jgi:hypothetical protein